VPAGRPRIDKFADADMLVLTRADEIFRTGAPPITPTGAIKRVVRAVLAKDPRWCFDLDGRLLHIGGPANFDSIVKRLLSRLEPTRFTKRGKRAATLPPRVRQLAIAKATDSRRGARRKLPGD
jgi:hypothetical protein